MILWFDQAEACSLKYLAVNKNSIIKPKSRSFNRKMLMLAKLSLMSSVYELVEVFYFPDKTVKKIYEKYKIEKVYTYHVLNIQTVRA